MSTVKATHFEHPSASTPGITLASDGSVVLPAGFTGGIGSNVVQAYKTNLFSTTSTSLVDVTDLTVTITPMSAAAKVLVVVSLTGGAVTENAIATVLRDATAIGNSTVGSVLNGYAQFAVGTNDFPLPGTMVFLDSPATTSAVTYKVQARMAAAGTFYVNRRSANGDFGSVSSITAIEVAA